VPHFFCSTLRLGSRSLCARSYDCCPDEKLSQKKTGQTFSSAAATSSARISKTRIIPFDNGYI
jgi:hypothetical protein